MKDKSEQPEEESGPVGGERLRAARRENDISVADIAKELHLDEPKVRALENNEFELLGAPVFAKGHLRKYAELVGISVEDIMTDYYLMNRSVGAPPVVGPKRKTPGDFSPGPWIVAFAVVGLLGGAAYWWITQEPAPAPAMEPATLAPFSSDADAGMAVTPDVVAVQESPQEPEAMESTPGGDDSAIDTTADLRPAEAAAGVEDTSRITVPVVAPTSGMPQVQIELAFSGDCWTEVSDGSGRRLYYDLGQAGKGVSLAGDAPLRVILGDANNVSIKIAGTDYTIPDSARTGRLARLTLNVP